MGAFPVNVKLPSLQRFPAVTSILVSDLLPHQPLAAAHLLVAGAHASQRRPSRGLAHRSAQLAEGASDILTAKYFSNTVKYFFMYYVMRTLYVLFLLVAVFTDDNFVVFNPIMAVNEVFCGDGASNRNYICSRSGPSVSQTTNSNVHFILNLIKLCK